MINIHQGIFRYNRLTSSDKPAPALFQQVMNTVPTGLTGTTAYIDNILIASETQDELFNRLFSVCKQI